MKAWLYLTKESFLILRRDKIFAPVLLVGVSIVIFANLASGWIMEDFEKVLFDVGVVGFRLSGGMVAILWGVKLIADPLRDRSIDLRIGGPYGRTGWLMSKYCGLVLCLMIMGAIFVGTWQVVMVINHFGWMSNLQNWTFGLLLLEWIVLGAFGMLMSTMTGFSTALFVSIGAWIAGLTAPLVAATMDQRTSSIQRQLIEFGANIWNFQRFNLAEQLQTGDKVVMLSDITTRLTWAGSVLAGTLALACWVFHEKDLT